MKLAGGMVVPRFQMKMEDLNFSLVRSRELQNLLHGDLVICPGMEEL